MSECAPVSVESPIAHLAKDRCVGASHRCLEPLLEQVLVAVEEVSVVVNFAPPIVDEVQEPEDRDDVRFVGRGDVEPLEIPCIDFRWKALAKLPKCSNDQHPDQRYTDSSALVPLFVIKWI
jgi:hypothetical protein